MRVSRSGDVTIDVSSLDFAPQVTVRTGAEGGAAVTVPLRPLLSMGSNERVWFTASADVYDIEVRPSSVAFCGASFQISAMEGNDESVDAARQGEADRAYWEQVEMRARTNGRAACRVRALLGRARPPNPPETSRALLKEALDTAQAELGPDHLLVAFSLEAMANALPADDRIEKGLPMIERALAIRGRVFDGDEEAAAAALNVAVRFCQRAGRADLAIPFAERRAELLRSRLGPEHPDTLTAMDDLGSAQVLATRFREGEATFHQVMETRARLFGESHPSLEGSFFNLAVMYAREGNLAASRPYYGKLIALLRSAPLPNASKIAMFEHDLATVLSEMGELEEARATLLRLRREDAEATGRFSYRYADDLIGVEWDAGNTAEAIRLQEELLGIRRERGRLHENLIAVVNYLGMLLDTGDFDRARTFYEEIRTLVEENAGAGQQIVASMLLSAANLRMIDGDRAAALELASDSVHRFETSLGPESPNTMDALTLVGDLESESGNLDAARAAYQRVLATSEKNLGPDHPSTARARMRLGELEMRSGDLVSAAALVHQSLETTQASLGPRHPQVAAVLVTLARIRRDMGDVAGARELGERAETISRDHLILTAQSLSERQALNYASMRASALPMLLDLAVQGQDADAALRAWEALARSRALVLDEMAARHRRGPTGDPETAKLEAEARGANARYASLLVRGPGQQPVEFYRKLLNDASDSKDAAEAALARRGVAFGMRTGTLPFDLLSARRSLPSGTALVAYASYSREGSPGKNSLPTYMAFVLAPGSAGPVAVPLSSAASVDELVGRWMQEAARPGSVQAYRSAGESLRRVIWDPLLPRLGKATTVLVVPDGALALVNFAALPVGRSSYLLERGPRLHYLSAERDLVRPADRTGGAKGGLLAVGGPDFDATSGFAALRVAPGPSAPLVAMAAAAYRGQRSGCTQFDTVRFDPLPGTEAEVREVSAMWDASMEAAVSPVSAVFGPVATEAIVKTEAAGHRTLHLATHGFFLGAHCPSVTGIARGVTGLAAEQITASVPTHAENPLLLSGLAFAGANHRDSAGPDEDDGILTAEEIAALDLSGVEWAVLSACDTGLGEIKAGEGVFGLRRAFQVAGARTLIMSLWSVEDESARAWMKALYTARLKEHLDTAASVRAASLAVLNERRARKQSTHPFYWAGFVAAGDWR
ncbi:MAG TPA: CHAT domain-containing tetratricopeptide repeat protein [Candidatus Polarisedimenticolaceae bacterium]|nr:CHAT domain-containing tetratricopeptide repeat protein [Candidatus Polarisedimenticolaceae bacterium]